MINNFQFWNWVYVSRAMARRPLDWVLRRRPCWGRVPAGGWRRRPWCRSSPPRTRPPPQPLRLLKTEWKNVRARAKSHINCCWCCDLDRFVVSPIKAKKRNRPTQRVIEWERCEDKRPKLSESEHNRAAEAGETFLAATRRASALNSWDWKKLIEKTLFTFWNMRSMHGCY